MPTFVRALFLVDLLLVVAHVGNFSLLASLDQPRQMFDLDAETNLPTWFASMQLALLGVLLSVLAYARRRPGDITWWPMLAISLVPFYLSVDEFVQLHERLGILFRSDVLTRTNAWMFVAVPVFLLTIAVLGVTSRRHWGGPRDARARLGLGLAIYIASAGLIEILANFVVPQTFTGHAQAIVEEGGELVGATLMVWGTLGLLEWSGVRMTLPSPQRGPARSAASTATDRAAG